MSINHAVDLNLSASIIPPVLNMAQYDANSRTIIATLWDGTSGFTIPTGSYIMVRFGKPDGTGGLYDETEAGEAITFSGNVVTAPVATQMLSVAGKVQADIEIYQSGATEQAAVKLATFCFVVNVEKAAYQDADIISSDYYNIIAAQIQQAVLAGEKAEEAIAAGNQAVAAATSAEQSKTAAAGSASSAAASATSANTAKAGAEAAKTAAETAKTAAETAKSSAETAKTAAANSATAAAGSASTAAEKAGAAARDAEDAEAWAVGKRNGVAVGSDDPAYHNNAKYYKEQASSIAGGGVTSFNGRGGDVEPQTGDYTKEMVGLGNVDNTSDTDKPVSTLQQTALNAKQNKITANGLLKGDGNGGVTAAQERVDYAGASTMVSVTLLAANWTGDEAPYIYTVTIPGVTATSVQEWPNDPDITLEQLEAWQAACVVDAGQAANSVTFKALKEKPTVDIPLRCILRKDM